MSSSLIFRNRPIVDFSQPSRNSVALIRNGYVAATLNRKKDEDGPPLAAFDPMRKIGFVSVSDGLGGSGKQRVRAYLEGQWQERTMAYVAARKVQEAARRLVYSNSDVLSGSMEEIHGQLQNAFHQTFSSLQFEETKNKIKSEGLENFPTTFSAAVLQEKRDYKRVLLFWVGDSPLFLYSPTGIMTTHQPEADLSYSGGCLTFGDYPLQARQFDFSPETPLLVVAASDGVVKFRDLLRTHYFLIKGVQKNKPQTLGNALTAEYQRHKQLNHVVADDTTIAMVSSMKPGEVQKLNPFAPTESIS